MRYRRLVPGLFAVLLLGGCSVANSNLPGLSYFAFEAKKKGDSSVLDADAKATSPIVTSTPNSISYRAQTFSTAKSDGLDAAHIEWKFVHGLRVPANDHERFFRRLGNSIREASRTCLREIGQYKRAEDIPPNLAMRPGKLVIDDITYIQYPLTTVKWDTTAADRPNEGKAFRLKSMEVVAFGSQLPISSGSNIALGLELRFHDVVDNIADTFVASLSPPFDVATVTGSCQDEKLELIGRKYPMVNSGWLRGIRGNFNVKITLSHKDHSGH